ncbi:MAG: hypothetical protein CMJ83_21935 [Planctomycetes bacterium]|nr:hypothetical protein [Planctomycetota bacterium]
MKHTPKTTLSLSIVLLSLSGAVAAQGEASSWVGPAPSGAAYPAGEETRRFQSLTRHLKQRGQIKKLEAQTLREESLILDSDRDPLDVILRRTAALLTDLARMRAPRAPDLTPLAGELSQLESAAEKTDVKRLAQRRLLFDQACHLRRRIAFCNPLLDFDEILVLKRHPTKYNHMCDQYYGSAQQPGGGLHVLVDVFGKNPGIRDLLRDSKVKNGRLQGQELSGGPKRTWNVRYDGMGHVGGDETEGGSFLSPDLSFDGKTVAFAYVECRGDRNHDHHTDPQRGHWAPQRSYHVFTVGIDGTNLRMLTDGTWNDFDPCFMPSGRIAFISERRGGYLRCGRVCPTYTLHDMAADGSGISCLSYHETNEWHPSVTHDGMIIWTRWDYVDRHGVTAHFPWITTPDGRDPRAVHGNYSPRPQRPDMETDPRAIPGSHKFVATAAPHHGQSFGSLVLIDPRIEDNDLMSPVKRLTPDVGFPETQASNRSALHYGQPWPLSEDYYLCSYEPQGGTPSTRRYGIYLVDTFGNRELIYRDPDIACHSPIPVKARPTPPVIPEMSTRLAEGQPGDQPEEATVSVVNVYNTRTPWAKGTIAKALRVYQVFPLSVASARVTHATGYQIPQAKDSINLSRAVLGTVPVEEDGSAHFIVPSRRELFFQVLDEDGLAITSMRSGTHFQPGETASCVGCHESKHDVPTTPSAGTLLAMRRAPSRLKPEAHGTNPFSYPLLVQPVLDQHCVKCHADNKEKMAPPLDGGIAATSTGSYMNPRTAYSTSYMALTPKFGFYDYGGKDFNDPKWYRTTPGAFGARASKLYALLSKGHYDVSLPPDDLRRITVWLDSCSPFYGVYEKKGGEAQLRGGTATPTLR